VVRPDFARIAFAEGSWSPPFRRPDLLDRLLLPFATPDQRPAEFAQIEEDVRRVGVNVKYATPGYDKAKGMPYYLQADDYVYMPPFLRARCDEAYYASLLHEVGHALRHPRFSEVSAQAQTYHLFAFGMPYTYARDEVIAETTALLLADFYGMRTERHNQELYIRNWLAGMMKYRRDKDTPINIIFQPMADEALERVTLFQGLSRYN